MFESKLQETERLVEVAFKPETKQRMVEDTNAALDAMEEQLDASKCSYELGDSCLKANHVSAKKGLGDGIGRRVCVNSSV